MIVRLEGLADGEDVYLELFPYYVSLMLGALQLAPSGSLYSPSAIEEGVQPSLFLVHDTKAWRDNCR